uniref:Reverse transcriptase domain-containing protein n=1 Tax=Tanacetum cinerariifolium TaxID=118510 RepID=A0A699GJY9_TANCI|nr:hypothetical protein [Tanacetum cinerariifolium]
MDTRSTTDLNMILEAMENDKKEMTQKMQTMQEQIQELIISQTHGEDSTFEGSVNRGSAGNWHPNDVKVDIPEYDGKLDPDEFVEWLCTVERVFDYKQTIEDNKVKIVALKLQKYASTWWSNTCLKQDDPQTLVRYLGGLEPRVANVVELHSYQTLAELTILSHKVDSQQRSKGNPCAIPTLLVPKKNGEWRMRMDSRSINKITIKYCFPIPRLNDLLDELHGSIVFSKIDLRSGYHQIRVYEGDEWKTAFKTKKGLYEWLVMPFGLSNAPSTFMRLMNHVLKSFLGRFMVIYFDDILGIQVDQKKVQAICDWPLPRSIQQVRSFYGFASFYRRFIRNFSTIVAPPTEVTKFKTFVWTSQAQRAFDELKQLLTSTLVLALPCFQEHYLIFKEFISHSDHEALKYIQGQHKLQPRHAKWVEFLQAFTFTIKHKSGKFNKGADALSCRYSLISSLQPKLIGFELLQNEYISDPDFGEIYANCLTHAEGTKLKFSTSSHPQTDSQTEVTNRTLGSLLRALVSSNLKQWEDLLPRDEFAYNRAPSKTTGISPFMAVYGLNQTTPLDLAALDTSTKFSKEASDVATDIKSIHQRIHDMIVKTNKLIKYRRDKGKKHVLFKPDDLVWLQFRKERFPFKRRSKLSPRSDGLFKVLAKVNDNAYEIKLPGDSLVSATINVADLQPYYDPNEPLPSLRSNFFNDRGDDRQTPDYQAHNSTPPSPTPKWISLAQLEYTEPS